LSEGWARLKEKGSTFLLGRGESLGTRKRKVRATLTKGLLTGFEKREMRKERGKKGDLRSSASGEGKRTSTLQKD